MLTHPLKARAVLLTSLLLLTACDGEGNETSAAERDGALPDASQPLDAQPDGSLSAEDSAQDAVEQDSDAAEPDATAADAGDVGLVDASLPDASLPDASLPDASPLDATLLDATLPDAGEPDAAIDASAPDAAPPAWATAPWPADKCEWVLTVGAHRDRLTPFAQDPDGFKVAANRDQTHCFYEQVPWGNTPVQVIATRARVESADDLAAVRALVVSGLEPGSRNDFGAVPSNAGDHKPCASSSGINASVWLPGMPSLTTYPNDVGVSMVSGSARYVELQVHYATPNREIDSRVQLDLCVTSQLRANTAGLFWLGFEDALSETLGVPSRLDNRGNGVGTGQCAAKSVNTRILSMTPHMRAQGSRSKLQVKRKDGHLQTLHDAAYSAAQPVTIFFDDLRLDAGDIAHTTCTWKTSPVRFGTRQQDELCFVYTLAYPIAAFKAGIFEKGAWGGDLACAGDPASP